ncbi:hypothetical protein K466DRAFT_530642 [Polyporus arcularius HHB13444]|uniref:TPR-like protein n=1 Tax=Polyporus arcularius HHB13444 TaxID=1314778 RepID=A0A5C3P1S5_9APHY|nr:hypothetical protein K466DRAFT_530642 [Polyporus arcularius HHB13444]
MANLPPGTTPELMASIQSILSGYQGRGGLDDIMRHLSTQDPSVLENLVNAVASAESSRQVDLENFDYASLPVKRNATWVVQLVHMGYQDATGRMSDSDSPGSRPTFQVFVYDERGTYRAADGSGQPGLPSSDFLLTAIKKAIASPIPPFRPQLPEVLMVARKLQAHTAALKPFLDSLPRPFTWRLETAEEEEEVASGVHRENVAGVAKDIRSAESAKERGNKAFASKNREQAVKLYSEAIESLNDAWAQKPSDAEERKIKSMFAVCYSNRAASYLLPGEGQDAKKALDDANNAVKYNPDYAKGYYRKAKAQQLLAQTSGAIDTLTSALSKANLAGEKGLNDALVEAYGGFPQTENELRQFCLDKFRSEAGDKRGRNLSEFRRRAEARLQEVLGPQASIDGL